MQPLLVARPKRTCATRILALSLVVVAVGAVCWLGYGSPHAVLTAALSAALPARDTTAPVDAEQVMAAAADLAHVLEDLSDPAKLAQVIAHARSAAALQDVAQRDPEVAQLAEDLAPVTKIFAQVHAALEQELAAWRAHPEDAERAAQKINSVLQALQPLLAGQPVDAPLPVGALLAGGAPRMSAPAASVARAKAAMETKADLKVLANELNPVIGFWDPIKLSDWTGPIRNQYDQTLKGSETETVGFLRQAEIKHGRVAMLAFVGYIVQANGIYFPWNINPQGMTFADVAAAGSPPDQWDALPTTAKVHFILFIGFLEWCQENSYLQQQSGTTHYMKGGKPGSFPSIKNIIHPIPLDFWDPLGFTKGMSEEKRKKSLLAEVNNGRLAMIGIMAFLCEAKIPGSVPALGMFDIPAYGGEIMAPFDADDVGLPFVTRMLDVNPIVGR